MVSQVSTQKFACVNDKKTKKIRNGWIELYRFIAISMILYAHFLHSNPDMFPHGWIELDNGQFGVMVFIMISGYCNVKSTKNRTGKFLITFLIWVFWGFIVALIFYYTGYWSDNPLSIFFGRALSGNYSSWWFMWIYLSFSLFQQFINKFIQKIDKWLSFGIILVFAVLWQTLNAINPEIPFQYLFLTFQKLFLFTWVYAIAGWVSWHYAAKLKSCSYIKLIFLTLGIAAMFVLLWFRTNILSAVATLMPAPQNAIGISFCECLIFTLAGITGLLFFDNLPVIKNRFNSILGFVGKITLAMYLTHPWWWTTLDIFYPASPEAYYAGFYILKFTTYYLVVVALSCVVYLFINAQEKCVNKIIHRIKNKKQQKTID